MNQAWLVEVKYRKDISCIRTGFKSELEEIRVSWPKAHVLVCLGDSPCKKATFIQDYVRIIPPHKDISYIVGSKAPEDDTELWGELHKLSSVFPDFSDAATDLDKILPVIKGLPLV